MCTACCGMCTGSSDVFTASSDVFTASSDVCVQPVVVCLQLILVCVTDRCLVQPMLFFQHMYYMSFSLWDDSGVFTANIGVCFPTDVHVYL